MSSQIHSTAIVEKSVELGSDVIVGPFAVLRGRTRIGSRCIIESHATVGSDKTITEIGSGNHIFQSAVVGGIPQDVSYKGEATKFIMGDNNIVREFVTLNAGTLKEEGVTRVGNNNMFMAYVHLGHDCKIGNNVIMANATNMAGHVEVQDFARIGGMGGAVQFCRIGKYAYIGADSSINKDILPFTIAQGNFATIRATNKIGLERAGFPKEEIDNINRAVRALIMGDRTIEQALQKIKEECTDSESIRFILDFVRTSKTGIAR